MAKIKLAAIQAASQAATMEDRWAGVDVDHALELLDQAAGKGANLACFPELYPMVGEDELCEGAKRHRMHVIAGLATGDRQSWQNTSTLIGPDGAIIGRQTKNYPTATEVDGGVVAGTDFEVFETELGRFGIVICADFAFFHDGVEACREGRADIIFNPAVWFAIAGSYPHTVGGRHLEYSVPIVGVNVARPSARSTDARFPPAGGHSTICVPPPVTDLESLWNWFCTKPGGIDSIEDFIHTLGAEEEIFVVEVDIDAVRKFPGYFSTRSSDRDFEAVGTNVRSAVV